tara:strand:+ start:427 stop:633 length:207 start_codon:yes stop_codon:yes gene_type:complete
MTENEIDKLAYEKFRFHPNKSETVLALAACQEERARIVRALEREAKAVDAGVSKPDLWALARLVDEML